jgi:drug/metabolite transporter (DMT)-like permease
MRSPQNPDAIKKWACIAAPAYVFALYFKYVLLWLDALMTLGSKEISAVSMVGAVNSLVTLLVASVVTAVGCYGLLKNKPGGRKIAGLAVILVGAFFVIYSLVALFVPVYAWFWYLTDFWMISLPVLGAAILRVNKRNA